MSTTGVPPEPPSAGTSIDPAPFTRCAEKEGTCPPACGGPLLPFLVPILVKSPTPSTAAARIPMKMKALRGVGPASGGGGSAMTVTSSMNVVADQDVTGHGDKQHRQVGDGVAEHAHG